MRWLVLLLCSCATIQEHGGFPFEEIRDVDLLTEEICVVMMWNDRLDKRTVRAVSLKKTDSKKYRVLPKVGQPIFCDDYYLMDTIYCK